MFQASARLSNRGVNDPVSKLRERGTARVVGSIANQKTHVGSRSGCAIDALACARDRRHMAASLRLMIIEPERLARG